MGFIIGLLTFVMVLDCVALVFLVLLQLPKKDAGSGLAFMTGTTDALFGAGSGNVLTKITKYAAGLFFFLAVVLSVMQSSYHNRETTELQKALSKPARPMAMPPPVQTPESQPPAGSNAPLIVNSNLLSSLSNATVSASNTAAPAAPVTPSNSTAPPAPK